MTKSCRCNCGYRCGGPGRCKLDVFECLQQKDGHYVRDCEHDWTGTMIEEEHPSGAVSSSVTCATCGLAAMYHDMAAGP